ncbi:hypothetical protein OOK13_04830 [Streptomyces sp. NBC_00378]|nr:MULTISPECIES: hypothetical protein [unclassified Streptomyces]MCX5107851.1 hypothetical protein [Streptomyces sp. NBC_00378]
MPLLRQHLQIAEQPRVGAVHMARRPSGAVTLAGRVPGILRRRQGRGQWQ